MMKLIIQVRNNVIWLSNLVLQFLYFLYFKYVKNLFIEVDFSLIGRRNVFFKLLLGIWSYSNIFFTIKFQEKIRKELILNYRVLVFDVFVLFVKCILVEIIYF